MAKGTQKITRRVGNDSRYSAAALYRNKSGHSWKDIKFTSPSFIAFMTDYVSKIPKCWVRPRARIIRRMSTASCISAVDRILEKLFITYYAPRDGTTIVPFKVYCEWRNADIFDGYGKWVIAEQMGIDHNVMDVVDI